MSVLKHKTCRAEQRETCEIQVSPMRPNHLISYFSGTGFQKGSSVKHVRFQGFLITGNKEGFRLSRGPLCCGDLCSEMASNVLVVSVIGRIYLLGRPHRNCLPLFILKDCLEHAQLVMVFCKSRETYMCIDCALLKNVLGILDYLGGGKLTIVKMLFWNPSS